MTSLTFLRRTLPFLAAFLMASCGDPTVSYWKKAADINTEYSEKSDALVQRLLKLKKNPTLPGLEESSRDAADLLRERDEELADLSTKNVDPAVTAYVEEDRKLFARGRELAERYQQYFEKYLKGGPDFTPDPSRAVAHIGRGRQEIRKILAEARKLEARAEMLRKEKSAELEQELPPLHFRLPELKQLLSSR